MSRPQNRLSTTPSWQTIRLLSSKPWLLAQPSLLGRGSRRRHLISLAVEELLQFDELYRKAHGLPTCDEEHHVIDEGPCTRKWYAAQRSAETHPASLPGSI